MYKKTQKKVTFLVCTIIFLCIVIAILIVFTCHFRNMARTAQGEKEQFKQENMEKTQEILDLRKSIGIRIQNEKDYQKQLMELATVNETLADESILHQQCYDELWGQFFQKNLLYCPQLELPIVRSVVEDNWNLIHDVYLVNSTHRDLANVELALRMQFDEIVDFYYMAVDYSVLQEENPPEEGWIAITPNANGNYVIPMGKIPADEEGLKYIVFKYTVDEHRSYYGLLMKVPE